MDRPVTTLPVLMSVGGKTNTRATDNLGSDRDLPKIVGVQGGLHQYYEIEQITDPWSLNSGKVQERLGVNSKEMLNKSPIFSIMIDSHHLIKQGIRYSCTCSKEFVLVTSNADYLAFQVDEDNLRIVYQSKLSLTDMFAQLKSEYGCQRVTIRDDDTLSGPFLREKLSDYTDIMIAPILVGSKNTSTLIDRRSSLPESELSQLGVLKLQECMILGNSYLRLHYQVTH